jgi:hypothetical protein
MSKLSKRKARRRRKSKASREQLIAIEVASRAHENRQAIREERKRRRLLDAMRLEAGEAHLTSAFLSRWELAELERINSRRSDPLLSLPDSAYEARHLGRYVEGLAD